MLSKTIGLFLLLSGCVFSSFAQQTTLPHNKAGDTQTALYKEIVKADSSVFDAFNRCDSITYQIYFTHDLEFYHDLGGLTVGLDNELKSFSEMCTRGSHIRRELIKSTLEV